MKKVVVTGISSGIGRVLAIQLIKQGYAVWGISRREDLLKQLKKEINSKNFHYTVADISAKNFWKMFAQKMQRQKFIPDIVVFNAAMYINDLKQQLDPPLIRKVFETNFFSILEGVSEFQKVLGKGHFIAVSSISALRGNVLEGLSYASSKASLSTAFESLYQKYKGKYFFSTIYFGPVDIGMWGERRKVPFMLTGEQAAQVIIQTIKNKPALVKAPLIYYLVTLTVKFLPQKFYFLLNSFIQKKIR